MLKSEDGREAKSMGANHTREIMNSAAVIAAVKKMSPSAIFIFGMVLTVG